MVYIILEAHHRFDSDAVMDLWSLVGRVYVNHPTLMTAASRSDIAPIARITLAAWWRLHMMNESTPPPQWIQGLLQKSHLPEIALKSGSSTVERQHRSNDNQDCLLDFDFDLIDWSFWENLHLEPASYALSIG